MTKPIILFHGTCVSTRLAEVFGAMPGIADHFEVWNGTFLGGAPVPERLQPRCELMITQDRVFGVKLPLLREDYPFPRDCATLRIPNLIFSSLWPLNCEDPRDRRDAEHPFGSHPRTHADRLALEVMMNVSDPKERRRAYMSIDLHERLDLRRYHEIHSEQLLEMERACDVHVAGHLLSTFRKERLFYLAHHPTPAFLSYVLAQIIAHPRFAPFRRTSIESLLSEASAAIAAQDPFHGEEVPIHPQVAEFFGLTWWSPELGYRINGRQFTFESWIEHYMGVS